MPFEVPMVWREPRSHLDDCCLCTNNINGFCVQSKHKVENSNIPSALIRVPHHDSMPVPEPPEECTLDSERESEEASPEAGATTREDQAFQRTVPYSHTWSLKLSSTI